MRASSIARATFPAALAALLVVGAGGLVACGEGGVDAKAANVTASPMPAGESWSGVYYHPIFGYLHLVEQGSNVIGRWMRTDQSAWGELSGAFDGNLLHYTWKEHKINQVGPAAGSKGKGYFSYVVNGEKQAQLKGQYGLNDEESGSTWDCQKQANKNPDLRSIPGDQGSQKPAGTLD